jgi:hypothetical protein
MIDDHACPSVVGIFRVPSLPGQRQCIRLGLGLGTTTEPRFVSIPEMVQMRPAGYWGPVTATLDWCEVRHHSSTHLTYPFHYVFFSGQLSVLSLCGRNLQHVLQSFLRLHISIRCTSVNEGVFTHSLSRRICCASFFASLLQTATATYWLLPVVPFADFIFNFEIFVGVCFSRAGKHFFPRNTPL